MEKLDVTGTVRLDCAPETLGALGAAFWEGLARRHPLLRTTCRQACDTQVDASAAQGECDLALMAAPYPRGARVQELYCCPVCLWVPTSSSLAEKRLLMIEDLAEKTVAVPAQATKSRDRLERLAEERGVALGGIVGVSDAAAAFGFAASGGGLGFTVRHLREHPAFAGNGLVRAVPLEGASWSFGVGCAAGRGLSRAEQALWDWCTDYAADLPRDRFCNRNVLGVCTRVP